MLCYTNFFWATFFILYDPLEFSTGACPTPSGLETGKTHHCVLHVARLPSQPASSGRGWVIDFIWLGLPWQYIAMTRNNQNIILILRKRFSFQSRGTNSLAIHPPRNLWHCWNKAIHDWVHITKFPQMTIYFPWSLPWGKKPWFEDSQSEHS